MYSYLCHNYYNKVNFLTSTTLHVDGFDTINVANNFQQKLNEYLDFYPKLLAFEEKVQSFKPLPHCISCKLLVQIRLDNDFHFFFFFNM